MRSQDHVVDINYNLSMVNKHCIIDIINDDAI